MSEEKNDKIPSDKNTNTQVEYVSAKQYAKHYKLHHETVLRWLKNGEIKGAIKTGRHWKMPL